MKHIRTKFIISMTALAFVVLLFTGIALIANISINYRREFYNDTKPIMTSSAVSECKTIDELSTTLKKSLDSQKSFYILKDGTVVFASVDGGQLKATDNLERILAGGSATETDLLWEALDYGVCLKDGLAVYVKDTYVLLTEQIKGISLHLIQALIIGFLLSVIISFLLSKKLTRSIGVLKKGAERMANGDFAPIEVPSVDEIGSLANVLNSMGSQIEKDYAEFERQEKVRRDFVANVSHELKTPLTVIKSYSETLSQMQLDTKTQQQFLQTIDTEVDRMSEIVSKLLEISHIEANIQTSTEQIDLKTLVHQITSPLLLQASQKNIEVTTAGQGSAVTNKKGAETILTSIIENAVIYTNPTGYINITVKDNAVTVKNSGAGIEKDDLEHIFERFYRADKARTSGTGGTGLGLAIAKECADAIGAKITVSSVAKEYTEFTVNFNAN